MWRIPKHGFTLQEVLIMAAMNMGIVCISGQLTGQDVDLLRVVLERETSAPVLDLKNLLLVDREAVKLLALRESNGTELRNCPAYIREWVTRERGTRIHLSQE